MQLVWKVQESEHHYLRMLANHQKRNFYLSRAHRKARHLQVILEWKWQRLDSYVYQKQLELCKQSVSDSACVVGSTKIQSPVLMKCHAFAFFSINQSENAFESELELCDFALQQRMAGPAVNRSACSTGEKFCLPCGVWRCFFILLSAHLWTWIFSTEGFRATAQMTFLRISAFLSLQVYRQC